MPSAIVRIMTSRFIFVFILVFIVQFVASTVCVAQPRSVALSPTESANQVVVDPAFEFQLVAHEPQVIDPVDAAFDDRGRLWVVEMRDYPFRTGSQAAGTIKILSDLNHDGVFESAQIFADRLEMPTGISLWKDGAVVTLAGRVVWLRDTNGDGLADQEQVWIEGFKTENEQLRANHPRLGTDGKWYIASGLRGGDIQVGSDWRRSDAKAVQLGSRDVRFDPSSGAMELITGPAQFGLCFDVLGRRYFCSNRNPAVRVLFEQEDLNGNPLTGLVPSVLDIIASGEKSHVYPLVEAWTTSNLHSGQFTAACGVLIHAFGDAPTAKKQHVAAPRVFACEPTGSLVHSNLLSESIAGIQETIEPYPENYAWFASRDAWCRPVNVIAAPDGSVLVLDMYRAVIEHPAWVPDELKNRADERWGNDCGRLYRVAPKTGLLNENEKLRAVTLRELASEPLSTRSDEQLAALVASGNEWLCDTARRLLIERASKTAPRVLESLALDSKVPVAGRVQALLTSATLARQLPVGVTQLLGDPEPQLQWSAIQVIKQLLQSDVPVASEVLEKVIEHGLASSSHEVQMEALLCIGQSDAATRAKFATRIAEATAKSIVESSNGALVVAAASALREQPETLLGSWLSVKTSAKSASGEKQKAAAEVVLQAATRLAAAIKVQETAISEQAIANLVESNTARNISLASLMGLAQRADATNLKHHFATADFWKPLEAIVRDARASVELRSLAIQLFAFSPHSDHRDLIGKLVESQEELPLRAKALRAWSAMGDKRCDEHLLRQLVNSSPQWQAVVAEVIGGSQDRLSQLAIAIENGTIAPRAVGSVELKRLATIAKGETQTQLNAALGKLVNSDRAKVLAEYEACLKLNGDPLKGKLVFEKNCASCHRIADVGVKVGPDISDSRTQLPAQLLTNILDPNRVIDNNYFRFLALTEDDQVVEGMIVEETAESIVLRGQNDVRHVLLRQNLKQLKSTGVSLMPEGVEAQVDQQAMADLIAFIKNWRYLDGSIPK